MYVPIPRESKIQEIVDEYFLFQIPDCILKSGGSGTKKKPLRHPIHRSMGGGRMTASAVADKLIAADKLSAAASASSSESDQVTS